MDPVNDQNKQSLPDEAVENIPNTTNVSDSGTPIVPVSPTPAKKTYKKTIGIFVAIVIISLATFAGLTTFLKKEAPAAVIPVAKKVTPKQGTITAVDDLIAQDIADEVRINDQTVKTTSDDVTDLLDETATLEEAYDGI